MFAAALLAVALSVAPAAPPVKEIPLRGTVNDDMVEAVTASVAAAKGGSDSSLKLLINSPGGEIGAGLEIIRILNASGMHVRCEVEDYAASMAAIIFEAACSERVVHQSSVVMFHEGHITGSDGSMNGMRSSTAMMEAMNRLIAIRIAPRLNMTPAAYMAKIAKSAWWEVGEDAVVDHVADEIDPDVHPAK